MPPQGPTHLSEFSKSGFCRRSGFGTPQGGVVLRLCLDGFGLPCGPLKTARLWGPLVLGTPVATAARKALGARRVASKAARAGDARADTAPPVFGALCRKTFLATWALGSGFVGRRARCSPQGHCNDVPRYTGLESSFFFLRRFGCCVWRPCGLAAAGGLVGGSVFCLRIWGALWGW